MGVHIIPHDQDPRPKLQVIYHSFRFNQNDFPPLPAWSYSVYRLHHTLEGYSQALKAEGAEETIFEDTIFEETFPEEAVSEDVVTEDVISEYDVAAPEDTADEVAEFDDIVSNNEEDPTLTAPIATFHGFLDLPTELREMIWEHAMRSTLHVANYLRKTRALHFSTPVEIREFIKKPNNLERPNFLPIMCRTSKRTLPESAGVYIRNSHFMVASFNDNRLLDNFLQTVPQGYEAIKLIHSAFFDCFPTGFEQNADLELAVRCTGLRTIKITFHMTRLIVMTDAWDPYDFEDDEDAWGPRPVQDMWSHYKLARLMDCAKLETLIIERKGRQDTNGVVAASNLGAHIKAEYFFKHKRCLNVCYTWASR